MNKSNELEKKKLTIKDLRLQQKLSRRELVELLTERGFPMDINTLTSLENEKRSPNHRTREALRNYFGPIVDQLQLGKVENEKMVERPVKKQLSETPETAGISLRDLRNKYNFDTQQELVSALAKNGYNVSMATIGCLERGERGPILQTLEALRSVFGSDLDQVKFKVKPRARRKYSYPEQNGAPETFKELRAKHQLSVQGVVNRLAEIGYKTSNSTIGWIDQGRSVPNEQTRQALKSLFGDELDNIKFEITKPVRK